MQIIKGGYQKIQMTEKQCLVMLCGKARQFMESCTVQQRLLIKKYIPYFDERTYRLGVLKLIPKVQYLILYVGDYCRSLFEVLSSFLPSNVLRVTDLEVNISSYCQLPKSKSACLNPSVS